MKCSHVNVTSTGYVTSIGYVTSTGYVTSIGYERNNIPRVKQGGYERGSKLDNAEMKQKML